MSVADATSVLDPTHTVRELTAVELAAAEPNISAWMLGEPGTSLVTTYPQVFRPEAPSTSFGVFDAHEALVCHAAVRRVSLHASRGSVATSLIGVVATDPEARGAHLASNLLQRLAERERDAGQDLLLLWSDRWEFYAKLGYLRAGVQAEFVIELPDVDIDVDESCRLFDARDIPALTRLHAQKPWRIERDDPETGLLVEHTSTHCYVLERAGQIVAYVCCRKGVDFAGWWHEFGGTDRDIARLLPLAMREMQQQRATILLPPYRNDLFELLQHHILLVQEGAVALAKPLTEAGMCEFFVDGLDSV